MAEVQELTGLDKAAILFNTLGPRLAAQLFTRLKKSQLLKIQQHAKEVRNLPFNVKKQVLEEFYFNMMAEKMTVEKKPGKKQPFDFLEGLNELQLAYLIRGEPPRSIAIILAQLPREMQTKLLKRLSVEERTEVLVYLGQIQDIPMEAVLAFATEMKEKAQQIPSYAEYAEGGPEAIAAVLAEMDSREQKQFMDYLSTENPELAKEVRKYHFTFENVPMLPDNIIRDVFNSLDLDEVALALKGMDEEFVQRVVGSLPAKKQAMFEPKEGPVPRKQVEAARKAVVAELLKMDADPNVDFKLADFMEADFIE